MAILASAELAELGVRHFQGVRMERLRLIFKIWGDEGRYPMTVIPPPVEEFRILTAELPFLEEIIQNPTSSVEDKFNANVKRLRWQELQRELSNGQNGATPSS